MAPFLVSLARPLIRPLIYLSVAAGVFCAGAYVGWDKRGDKAAKESLAAEYKAEQVRQATEDGWRRAHWDLAYAAEEKRIERDRQVQSDIDALRAGTIRVRERFVCPKMPNASPANAGNDERGEAGLLREDAEFLLRLGSEADRAVIQLSECQAYVRTILNRQE